MIAPIIRCYVERAAVALRVGDVASSRRYLESALAGIEADAAPQDRTLDAWVTEPERRAPRTTPPQHL
jgi:hypothetical protein